jgi:hypothetical protein
MTEDGREWEKRGERMAESSGILKKIRGRFGMARLKAIESRSGFRYGRVSASRPPGGGFVGGTPTLLEGRAFKMILLSMILPYPR